MDGEATKVGSQKSGGHLPEADRQLWSIWLAYSRNRNSQSPGNIPANGLSGMRRKRQKVSFIFRAQ